MKLIELLDSVPLIEHALFKNFKATSKLKVLNSTEERILAKVKFSFDSTMSEIAQAVGLEKGPFSQRVDKLVKSGYLKRRRSEKDRRIVYLSLTEQGEIYAEMVQNQICDHFENILSVLSREEREELMTALKVIKKTALILLKK